ncbi:uncharacterized protein [Nicotiana sylvestris]|uniref:uncharacterized protein n=1 Tax=Nicotiana sylvestris TaxID=4096 RepID=UPI00388CB7B7
MPFNDTGMPSVVRPQAPVSWAPPILFSTAPVDTRIQLTLPQPYVVPPMFTFQRPQLQSEITYVTPYTFIQPPQYYLSGEQEKIVKNPEQEEVARKMKSLEQSLKNMEGLSGQKSVSYSDLCMFPHIHLPAGFKMPKFEKYNGHGDPVAHLKRYCNQLRRAGGKEELLMAYFGKSLTGIASQWYTDQKITHWHVWDNMAQDFVRQFRYNVDIASDRNSLSNLKKKITESFREYAVKWRDQAAMAQEADYFQNMMAAIGKPFAEAIKIGEMEKNGLKTGRILSHVSFKATSPDVENGS